MLCSLIWASLFMGDVSADTNPALPDLTVRFQLPAMDGSVVDLSHVQSEYVVLVFMGCGCPLVQQYLPLLEDVAKNDSAVTIIGLMPNWHDSTESIQQFIDEHHVSFPVVRDQNAAWADRLGVTRTPEVVLLDRSRQVRYRGAIDDRYGINYRRTLARHNHIEEALADLKSGRPVAVPMLPPVGCLIGRAPTTDSDANVTWYGSINAIFQRHCQECHRPNHVAPFSLLQYEEAAG